MYGTIYKITNKINNKIYIGQTVQTLSARWYNHLQFAKHLHIKGGCSKLARAIRKYGEQNFSIEEVIKADSKEELDKLEDKFIQELDCINSGYNLKSGGANGRPSDETKKKMSETQKRIGNTPPHTPESIEKMRQTKIGKPTGRKGKTFSTKRAKPCIVNGFIYPTINAAAKCENICKQTLESWLTGRTKPQIPCEFLFDRHKPAPKRQTNSTQCKIHYN